MSAQHIVWGIPINDAQDAKRAKMVMTFSAISAVFAVISFIVSCVQINETGKKVSEGAAMSGQTVAPPSATSYVAPVLPLLINLAIMACGFFGAKNRNRSMLCWYWVCVLISAIIATIGCIILFAFGGLVAFAVLAALDTSLPTKPDDVCNVSYITGSGSTGNCGTCLKEPCSFKASDGSEIKLLGSSWCYSNNGGYDQCNPQSVISAATGAVGIIIGSGILYILVAIFNFTACCYGKALHDSPSMWVVAGQMGAPGTVVGVPTYS